MCTSARVVSTQLTQTDLLFQEIAPTYKLIEAILMIKPSILLWLYFTKKSLQLKIKPDKLHIKWHTSCVYTASLLSKGNNFQKEL